MASKARRHHLEPNRSELIMMVMTSVTFAHNDDDDDDGDEENCGDV